MRTAALLAIGKKVFDEARKPENQRRIKQAMAGAKQKAAAKRASRTASPRR